MLLSYFCAGYKDVYWTPTSTNVCHKKRFLCRSRRHLLPSISTSTFSFEGHATAPGRSGTWHGLVSYEEFFFFRSKICGIFFFFIHSQGRHVKSQCAENYTCSVHFYGINFIWAWIIGAWSWPCCTSKEIIWIRGDLSQKKYGSTARCRPNTRAIQVCTRTFPTWLAYFEHSAFHSSVLRGALCLISSCSVVFRTYRTFKSHVLRHYRKQDGQKDNDASPCPVPSCGSHKWTRMKFTSYIVDLFKNSNDPVVCPSQAVSACWNQLCRLGPTRLGATKKQSTHQCTLTTQTIILKWHQ